MKRLILNAANWKTISDFYGALREAVGSPAWHGHSIDAFIDSIVYGGINEEATPYVLEIDYIKAVDPTISREIELFARALERSSTKIILSNCKTKLIITVC